VLFGVYHLELEIPRVPLEYSVIYLGSKNRVKFDSQTTGSVKYSDFTMTYEYMCIKLAGPESGMFSRYHVDIRTT